jgi:CRISPR-associated protein Csx10
VKHLSVHVIAQSPLAIRSDHAEGGASTARHIPGTTLLGSLATAHRILHPQDDKEITELFLSEQISFPNLYPAFFKERDMLVSGLPVMPMPKTAQTCKRFSGFKPLPDDEDADEERHGIRDTLLDWTVFSLLELESEQHILPALLVPLKQLDTCTYSNCNQAMEQVSGYYRRDRDDPHLRAKALISTRLQTRTGINRDWGVVEDGILYNREVFDENMRFWGEVLVPDELADTFVRFVKEANDERVIRIGTGRTRGLGCVEVATREVRRENIAHFIERLVNFDATLRKQAEDSHVVSLDPFYFAVTLYSASILCDQFLRYRKSLDGAMLGKMLNQKGITFKRVYQATGIQRVTGWNELWGTPRMNDYALETGSTFLFSCSSALHDALIQALYALEETGIGRRRSEGFGRISISDPFHLEREQV